jgi:hypothetical protein
VEKIIQHCSIRRCADSATSKKKSTFGLCERDGNEAARELSMSREAEI